MPDDDDGDLPIEALEDPLNYILKHEKDPEILACARGLRASERRMERALKDIQARNRKARRARPKEI